MNTSLSGTCALVAGASGHLGGAIARALAEAGASVAVAGLSRLERAQELASDLCELGCTAKAVSLDVTSENSWRTVVADVNAWHGPITTLVNSAGMKSSTVRDRGLLDMDLESWDQILAVNLRGPMLGARAVLPTMLDAGGGSIISVSSIGGAHSIPHLGTAYGTSKAGLHGLTRAIAVSYGTQGIRCNAVAPGPITAYGDVTAPYVTRPPEPADVASAVAFLASPAGSFYNGQVLVMDGGLTAHTPAMSDINWRGSQ